MEYIKYVRKANSELVSFATELFQATSRDLILATSGIYLVWYFVFATETSRKLTIEFFPITVVVSLTCIFSLLLLSRWLLAAQIVWLVGFTTAITQVLYVSQQPEISFLYAILPLMAVVTLGWPAGIFVELLLIPLVWWLTGSTLMPPLPTFYGPTIILGGALTGLLGWTSVRTLFTAIQWHLHSFNQAQEQMEEANQHRAKVVRVVKDLDMAYHRLERANHMLAIARSEAEETREARNRFVLAVSHELRTPLNLIMGFSELMVNSPETYAKPDEWPLGLYEDIQEIYNGSAHLMRLVNDVLDLGQIEAMRMVLLKEKVNPGQIIQEVKAIVQPAFTHKGLWFQTEIQPDLPEVLVDHTRIRQILLNLVNNSLRFTEQGGVTIRCQIEEEDLLFHIQDTGPGIAKEDIPKLFEEFRQIKDRSWRRREGTGLGIPISRHFVELHGGRMWVESQVGEETSFYFTLPLRTARDLPLTLPEEISEAYRHPPFKGNIKDEKLLLVLSPNPDAGEVIARGVEDYSSVVTISHPNQIHKKMADLLPSAIILDQSLTQDKEIQATLQNLPYDLPVISLTFPSDLAHSRILPEGVSGYLAKPIGRKDLVETVQSLGPDIHNVLVIDDDPGMVRFVKMAFKSIAKETSSQSIYQLVAANTGKEAFEWLQNNRPDAILLDLVLPDISGLEVLEKLQQHPDLNKTPVIIITAHDWPQLPAADDREEVLRVIMHRPLFRYELDAVLKCLTETIRPAYPANLVELTYPPSLAA